MGHRPNEWEYWAVVACSVGIGVISYFEEKKEVNCMGKYLEQCCNDAWEVIRGRKRIVGNKIIDVKQNSDYEEDLQSTEYGWLSPKGEFYPVEFGNHQAWASDYLLNLYRNGKISYEEVRVKDNANAGDLLIKMGWILIHNPSRQHIKISKDESKRETKPQKQFLYDFFCKHGMTEKANELYE